MFFSISKLAFININAPEWGDCVAVEKAIYDDILEKVKAGTHTIGSDGTGPIAVANPPHPELTAEQVFSMRMSSLDADYEMAIGQLRSGYPLSETISWSDQVREAREHNAWVASGAEEGSAPVTPFIDNLLAARSAGGFEESKNELAARIAQLHNIVTPPFAQITGARHVAERALVAAKDDANPVEALKAVTWNLAPAI